jgi:hypothetical protein
MSNAYDTIVNSQNEQTENNDMEYMTSASDSGSTSGGKMQIKNDQPLKVLKVLKELKERCRIDWSSALMREVVDYGYKDVYNILTYLMSKDMCKGEPFIYNILPRDRYEGQYRSYINPSRIRNILVEHLNRHSISPEEFKKNDMQKTEMIKTDDPDVYIQLLACNSRGGFKSPKSGIICEEKMEKVIYSYGFYVKLFQDKYSKFLPIGETNAQKVSLDSDRVEWGYAGGAKYPSWIEHSELSVDYESKPKAVVETDKLLITLKYNNKAKYNDGGKKMTWSFTNLNTMYPVNNLKLNRLRLDVFHWLEHEVAGDLFCIYERLKKKAMERGVDRDLDKWHAECKQFSITVKYNTLRRLENVYLPDENNKVFAISK